MAGDMLQQVSAARSSVSTGDEDVVDSDSDSSSSCISERPPAQQTGDYQPPEKGDDPPALDW
eukprot:4947813-Lingulodinium_polyedra.AAC.1